MKTERGDDIGVIKLAEDKGIAIVVNDITTIVTLSEWAHMLANPQFMLAKQWKPKP
jgi:hypothetical protein